MKKFNINPSYIAKLITEDPDVPAEIPMDSNQGGDQGWKQDLDADLPRATKMVNGKLCEVGLDAGGRDQSVYASIYASPEAREADGDPIFDKTVTANFAGTVEYQLVERMADMLNNGQYQQVFSELGGETALASPMSESAEIPMDSTQTGDHDFDEITQGIALYLDENNIFASLPTGTPTPIKGMIRETPGGSYSIKSLTVTKLSKNHDSNIRLAVTGEFGPGIMRDNIQFTWRKFSGKFMITDAGTEGNIQFGEITDSN